MEFVTDPTKERYLFLKQFFSDEARTLIARSKGLPEATGLLQAKERAGYFPSDDKARAIVEGLTMDLARGLETDRPQEWVPNAARNVGQYGFHAWRLQHRAPFRGLHLVVSGSERGPPVVRTDGTATWHDLYKANQARLTREQNHANIKYYLILRTAWELSNYSGQPEGIRWEWDAPEFIASANDRLRSDANIKRVWYNHFSELTSDPALLFSAGGNSPTRGVHPELLPLVKALVDWFEETYPQPVAQYTRRADA